MLSTMLAITNRMVEKLTPEIIEETIKAFVDRESCRLVKIIPFRRRNRYRRIYYITSRIYKIPQRIRRINF